MSEAWAHILNKKQKSLQPQSEKCFLRLAILNMSKVIEFFKFIPIKLLLGEMLNLMKIS